MKFLVDAQLPRRLVTILRVAGHEAVHTLDLPNGNRTSDVDILIVSAQEQRIVITKDADFIDSFVLKHQPEKLLLISTGNIANTDLETLLITNLPLIVTAFSTSNFVEINRTALIIHP